MNAKETYKQVIEQYIASYYIRSHENNSAISIAI
jgi:hypothetical protein